MRVRTTMLGKLMVGNIDSGKLIVPVGFSSAALQ